MAGVEWKRPKNFNIIPDGDFNYTWYDAVISPETGKFSGRMLMGTTPPVSVRSAFLIVDGVKKTSNRAGSVAAMGVPNFTISGTPQQWGLPDGKGSTLRSTDIGLSFAFKPFDAFQNRHYNGDTIDLNGFDLSALNDDVTVTNIKFVFNGENFAAGGGTFGFYITDVRLILEATITHRFTIENQTNMLATIRDKQSGSRKTEVIYEASRKDGTYVGRIQTTTMKPSVSSEINSLHSSMTMTFGQNDTSTEEITQQIVTEIQENMLTELGYNIAGSVVTPIGLGEGTNIDTNINIDTIVRYGEWMPWLTEDGNTVTTEDSRVIVVADGYPDGRNMFSGYISQWELSAANTDSTVNATILSHSQELSNIMLKTEAEPAYWHRPNRLERVRLGSLRNGYVRAVMQTIQITTGSKTVGGIELYDVIAPGTRGDVLAGMTTRVKVFIIDGGIGSANFVAEGVAEIPVQEYQQPIPSLFVKFKKPVRMTSGKQYQIIINAEGGSKSPHFPYPLEVGIDRAATFSTGAGYESIQGINNPWWHDRGWDLAFTLYEEPNNYKRTFFSQDPSLILMTLLDFAKKEGARVGYTRETIEMTGTVVTLRFNDVTTIESAIASVFKSMPADWHYYYDPATNYVHAHPRPEEVTTKMQRGKNVVGRAQLIKTIEQMVNDVAFIGGDKPDGTTLVVFASDTESIAMHRRGFKKLSDGRFKDEESAKLVVQAEIDRGKNPVFTGEATLADKKCGLLDLKMGTLAQYQGFSKVMDTPIMQIVAITHRIETVDIKFNILRPRMAKRIQDLKRNLDNREAEMEN